MRQLLGFPSAGDLAWSIGIGVRSDLPSDEVLRLLRRFWNGFERFKYRRLCRDVDGRMFVSFRIFFAFFLSINIPNLANRLLFESYSRFVE